MRYQTLFVLAVLAARLASAQSTWTATTDGTWSTASNWNGGAGPVPTSSDSTQLFFNADAATTYTATNDLGAFTLNSLSLLNNGTGSITVAAGALTFAGINPAILDSGSGAATINSPITFADGMTITNSGSGAFTLSDGVAYTGTNVTLNLANTGGGTFSIGNLAATVTGTLNITSGAVKFSGNTAGDLFGDALILNVASGASFDFASNGEGFGGISGGGNITLGSAGLTFQAAGDRTYTGAINGTGAVTQNNGGVLSLGGANTYSGNTTIQNGGTIKALGANVLSPNSAVIIAAGQGTLDLNGFSQTVAGLAGAQLTTNLALGSGTLTINGSGTGVRTFNGFLSGTGNLVIGGTAVQSITGVNTYTGSTTVNSGTLRINALGLQSGSGVTIASGGTLDAIVPSDLTWTAPLSGTGNFTKTGAGTLTFSTPIAASPATLTVNTGTLLLDHSSNNNAKFAANPALVLNSGTLSVQGNIPAATTETFNGMTLTGGGQVRLSNGQDQNATLNLGAISRRIGTSVNFVPILNMTPAAVSSTSITTTTPNGAAGILGGYAVVNGTDWAVSGSGAGPFTVTPLPAASYTSNTWSAGTHTDVTSSFALASAGTTASVRFNTPAANTVTLVGTNNVSTGGILVTPNVGANGSTIAAGNLTAPANQELLIHQYDTAGSLTISSIISNTAGSPVTQTVQTLGTTTTMTVPSTAGLFPGMLITAGTNIPAASNAHIVSVNSPTQLTISFSAAPTAGSNIPVTFTPGTYVSKSGPGTLVLSGVNTFNGSLVLNEGTVSAGAITNLGSNSASGSSSVIFNGGTLRLTGAFSAGSSIQPYMFGPGGGTIEVANAGQTHTKQGNSISGSGTLTKAGAGNLSIGSNGSAFNGQVIVNGGVLLFQSNQFQSAQGVTVNPGGQYQINDDAVNGNFNIVAGGVMSLNGAGPAGSTTPGAFALTDQSGTSTTAGGPQTNFNTAVYLAGDATVGVYNGSSTVRASQLSFNNPVSGPGNLLKTGNGTLVLSNAFNTYGNGAGVTAISNGTVRIANGNNRLPTGTTLVFGEVGSTNNGTFDLNGLNQTVAGLSTVGSASGHQIINSSLLAVVPTLTVNYNGGTPQTFGGVIGGTSGTATGLSLVKSGTGTLTLSGSNTYTGSTTVSGGTLRVFANNVARPYTVADGAGLSVVNSDPGTAFSMSSLSLGTSGASNLGFELTGATAPSIGVINVASNNGLTANGTVNVSVSSAQPLTVGQFPLLKYSGAIQGGGFGAFAGGTLTLPSRVLGNLVDDSANSSVDLKVTGVDFIKWTGATDGNWDINSTPNWKLNSNNAATTYLESPAPGDTVVFDETAAGTHNVNLTTTLTPSAVSVNGPSDYTFGGPGKLSGPTGLIKAGAGTLTVLTNNSNAGATTVNGGTLRIGNGGTSGGLGSGNLIDNAAVIFDRSDDVTFAGNVSGTGTLTKNGAGTLAVSGGYNLGGDTSIAGGTLSLSGGTTTGNIGGAGALLKTSVGTLVLAGNAAHTGGTTISAGTLQIGNGGTSGTLAGDVLINAGATLAFNRPDNSTFAGNLSGEGGISNDGAGKTLLTGALTYTGTTVVSAGTLEFGSAGDTTLNGKVSGAATIVKSGAGQLTLLNANGQFTGTVIVNQGTVLLDDLGAGGDLNPSTVAINNGGKFVFGFNGNPDFPESTDVIVNSGGEFEMKQSIGEVFGGLRLDGGTFRLTGNNGAVSTTVQGTTAAFVGYDFLSGTVVATNTGAAAGTLSGVGLTKRSPGTVTFTGKTALNGAMPVDIQEGALAFEPANVPASGAGVITLGDGTTTGVFRMVGAGSASTSRQFQVNSGAFDVPDAGGTLTVNSLLNGGGNLAKTGAGTLVLTPSGGMTGTTSVQAGMVRLGIGGAGGAFTVANGATLALANGSVVASSITLSALSLGSTGSTIAFELNSTGNPTVPLLVVANTDGLSTNGGTHTLSVSNPQPLSVGQFTLIDYDGAAITSGFNLATLPARTAGTLVYNTANTSIDLNVTGLDSTLWNGNISGDWDVGTAVDVGGTKNFKLASNGTPTNFFTGDRVTFDDSATGTTVVNLTTALQPSSVTASNDTLTYTFQGPGSITGSTGLTKQGLGTLVVATDNNYTGATTVISGTLQIGNGGTTGSVTSNINVFQGATLAFKRSDTLTYGGAISGAGDIVKNGGGTLTLLGSNPFTGTFTVNQGTVLLDDLGQGGDLNASSVVVNNGATFIFGENGNVDFPNATVVTVNAGGLFDLRQGEVYGGIVLKGGTYQMSSSTRAGVDTTAQPAVGYVFESGTVTTNFTGAGAGGHLLGATFLDKVTPGTVNINGTVGFDDALTINIKEGTLEMGVANVPASGSTTVTLGDQSTGGTLRIRDAGATSSIRPFSVASGGGTIDMADAGGLLTLNGIVSGSGALSKAGAGTLVLAGVNDYSGAVSVGGGRYGSPGASRARRGSL